MYLSINTLKVESQTETCMQVVYFWKRPQEAGMQGREKNREGGEANVRKCCWDDYTQLVFDPRRHSEDLHECSLNHLSRSSKREACISGSCPRVVKSGHMHTLHFQVKHLDVWESVPEISMLQHQRGLKAKNGNDLAQTWGAVRPVLPRCNSLKGIKVSTALA